MKIKRITAIFISIMLFILSIDICAFSQENEEQLDIGMDPVVPFISMFSALPSPEWTYTETDFSALPLFNLTGKGVRIGIIDSGISPHQNIPRKNIVSEKSFIENDPCTTDGYNHGTGVVSLIIGNGKIGEGVRGFAPDAEIVNAKVTNNDGAMRPSDVTDAINYCVEQGCDIINMSFGTRNSNIVDYTKYNDLVEWNSAIENAISKGCIVIAAAGNSGNSTVETDFLVFPAALPDVIAVGSTSVNFGHPSFSQKNSSVFISAPGKSVLIATASSETEHILNSGTSFSAPIVSAFAALIKEAYPDATQSDVKEILKACAIDLGDEGYDYKFGHGIINGKNLAIALRNTDFYTYFNQKGQAVCANLGTDKNVSGYTAIYSGARNTSVSGTPFTLKYMEEKAIDLPETGTVKQFFWYQGQALSPICSHLVRQ